MNLRYPKRQAVVLAALVAGLFCAAHCARAENSVPPPTNMVSWWPGNGNALDARGLNNGTYLGNDIQKPGKGFNWRLFLRRIFNNDGYRPGKVGRAFNFNGFGRHVRVPDSPSLHLTDALTIEAWVYLTQAGSPTSYSIIVKYDGILGVNQSAFGFSIKADSELYLLVSRDGRPADSTQINSTGTIPVNQWTHVAATYDGSSMKLYINGILDSTLAYSGGIFPGTDDLGIGANVGGMQKGRVAGGFVGMIDEPAIYNRALSAEEIKGIYDAGSAGKYLPMSLEWIIGLAAVLLAVLMVVWVLVRLRRRKKKVAS
jgi:hypothetical protein